MSKGSSNFKSKKSHTSKPYDVSQSFVAKVASRVSELLPQRTWLNKWLSPAEVEAHHCSGTSLPTSTPLINSHSNVSPEHGPGPAKRPRLPLNSPPPFMHNRFLQSTGIHEDEISPIGPATIPNDTEVPGPSGLCKFNPKNNLTPVAPGGTDSPQLKLGDKLNAAVQRSSVAEKLNGGDDCSETSESTSGCSSLVPQAQTLQNRRSESRHLSFSGRRSDASGLGRSLFPGRSSPKIDLTSLHRRRPSFDPVTFTNTSRLLHMSANPNQMSSPFYSGRTMYGGASSHNTSLSTSGLFSQSPRRSGVTVRPVNANTPTEPALSTTAKKILDALEQFSTPVVDAKKLPIIPGSKRKLERYAELSLPTTAELLRVKRRERLQKSTSAARQASLSSAHQEFGSSAGNEYRIRNDNVDKHTSKMTRKSKEAEGEQLEDVKLPPAVLPVKTLPKIDIPIPPCPKTLTTVISNPVINSNTTSCATTPLTNFSNNSNGTTCSSTMEREFKISAPLPVQSDIISRTSLNTERFNFVFSEPIGQNSKRENSVVIQTDSNKSKDNCNNSNMFCFMNAVSDNKSVGNSIGLITNSDTGINVKKESKIISSPNATCTVEKKADISTASAITSTSTNSKTISPENNYWKCPTCMVKNKDNICTACDTKKTAVSSVSSSSPLVFKPLPDTWECKECYIRNKNSANICAACSSPKISNKPVVSSSSVTLTTTASTTVETGKGTSTVSTSTKSVTSSSTSSSGFGSAFKLPNDTWECKECFVRNKNTSDKCVACQNVKPGSVVVSSKKPITSSGFGNLFKKPEGSWECGSCMLQNDGKVSKCVACETPKPGAEKESGLPATSSVTSSGFKFGIIQPTSTSNTGFTFGSNKEESKTVTGFQFGGSSNNLSSASSSANFTFGIPATKSVVNDTDNSPKEKKSKSLVNDKLPNPLQELAKLQEKQSSTMQNNFKFGVNHDKLSEKQDSKVGENSSKNLFSNVEDTKSNEFVNKTDDVIKNKSEGSSTFSFGANTAQEKTDNSANKTTNFMFHPKPDQSGSTGSNLLFGNLTNKMTTSSETKTTQSELFTFGSSAVSSSPAFSAPTSTTKSNPNPIFLFGSATSANENKSNTVFGSSSTDSNQKPDLSVSETKPVFGSGKDTPSVFGTSKPDVKTPVFNSSLVNDSKPVLSSTLTNCTNVPTFAAPAVNSTNTPGNLQGFKQEPPASAPSFLGFGSSIQSPFQNQSTGPPQQEKSLFSVNNSNSGLQTIPTTQAGGFTFGTNSGASDSDQTKPAFGFSSQTPSSGFSFAPSSTTAQTFNFTPKEAEPAVVGFNFSAVPSVPNNQTPAPSFGVQNATPSFGSNTTSNSVFAFGTQSAQPQPQSATNTPVFGFNSTSGNTPASNAFVFGSSANTDSNQNLVATTVPEFDPNVRPTYNFTGGSTPLFTATPVTRRPMKKAVRRSGNVLR